MSRRKRRKVRAFIQGRKLKGHTEVCSLGEGLFSYRGHVFDIEDFPSRTTINLDNIEVEPIALLPEETQQSKKKRKKWPKNENAVLYSNKKDCWDVQRIL